MAETLRSVAGDITLIGELSLSLRRAELDGVIDSAARSECWVFRPPLALLQKEMIVQSQAQDVTVNRNVRANVDACCGRRVEIPLARKIDVEVQP